MLASYGVETKITLWSQDQLVLATDPSVLAFLTINKTIAVELMYSHAHDFCAVYEVCVCLESFSGGTDHYSCEKCGVHYSWSRPVVDVEHHQIAGSSEYEWQEWEESVKEEIMPYFAYLAPLDALMAASLAAGVLLTSIKTCMKSMPAA